MPDGHRITWNCCVYILNIIMDHVNYYTLYIIEKGKISQSVWIILSGSKMGSAQRKYPCKQNISYKILINDLVKQCYNLPLYAMCI